MFQIAESLSAQHLAVMMKVVLFDLEGTLVKTEGPITIRELRNQTKHKLLKLGIPSEIISKTDKATIMRNEANKYAEKCFGDNRRKFFNLEFDKFMKDYEVAAAQSSVLFDETLAVLEELREMGTILGIVTNTSREALETIFSKHQIGEFFQVVITREDVKMLKPSPEGIRLALRRVHREDKPFFFVGDSEFDITATTKAKGISILVCRKCSDRSTKRADHTVPSLLEIPKIISRTGNSKNINLGMN